MEIGLRNKSGQRSRVFFQMPEPDLSLLFIRPLNRLGIRYIVTGSVAALLYGEPRLTHDVDFVVFLRTDDGGRVLKKYFFSSLFFFFAPSHLALLACGGV